ncbi:hypothetical protein [Parahaliea aestuarii]|uniref:Right handed beta helix domain-containing protein n=1 Tax=Parahaliea aestuarii TaxID=1852021 RepID=A0A5C8ZPQ2_9GAMM|nr:hypothetical protein [Parahaliea aestuarii]TXS89639.1 hypothetical protein FVW59_16610 [Parahaliea aestuarii]
MWCFQQSLVASLFALYSLAPEVAAQAVSPALAPVSPIQQLVNAARPGATLSLPPGTYAGGLVVRRALQLNMQGVRLQGVALGKAVLVIEGASGPVIVNDFHADGAAAGAQDGNLAGIRIAGRNFDVTLNRVHIRNTAMGIMTDNRGGVLRLRNSNIGDIGRGGGAQSLSHVVYAGAIDRLEIIGSLLGESHHLGHLLKSRAMSTTIEDSELRGGDSRHSRVIDLPCGGVLSLDNVALQRSVRADNRDLIGIGLESAAGCGARDGAASVSIENSLLELGESPEDFAGLQTLYLFNWPAGPAELRLRDNVLRSSGFVLRGQMAANGPAIRLGRNGIRTAAGDTGGRRSVRDNPGGAGVDPLGQDP